MNLILPSRSSHCRWRFTGGRRTTAISWYDRYNFPHAASFVSFSVRGRGTSSAHPWVCDWKRRWNCIQQEFTGWRRGSQRDPCRYLSDTYSRPCGGGGEHCFGVSCSRLVGHVLKNRMFFRVLMLALVLTWTTNLVIMWLLLNGVTYESRVMDFGGVLIECLS